MDLITIAKDELILRGFHPLYAEKFAQDLFIGFPKMAAEKYAQEMFNEGARKQKLICANTRLITRHCAADLDLAKAIQHEVRNAEAPEYKK